MRRTRVSLAPARPENLTLHPDRQNWGRQILFQKMSVDRGARRRLQENERAGAGASAGGKCLPPKDPRVTSPSPLSLHKLPIVRDRWVGSGRCSTSANSDTPSLPLAAAEKKRIRKQTHMSRIRSRRCRSLLLPRRTWGWLAWWRLPSRRLSFLAD